MTALDWPDDLAQRHRVAAGAFGERVRGVRDWSAPAPPEGWDAADVVRHLLEWLPGLLSSRLGVELPAVATDDLVQAWQDRSAEVDRLLAERGDQPYESEMFGQMTLAEVVDRFYTNDVVMHTWDLARATGQDDTLDPDACAAMLAGMRPIEDVMRGSGQYGPRVEVPVDADVQTRLLGFIGRDPYWRP